MKELLVRSEVCVGCRSCEIACIVAHSQVKNLMVAISEDQNPRKRIVVKVDKGQNVPKLCHHCSDMPCVHACRVGAMYLDEMGYVQVDEEECIGCWLCIKACPYDAITKGENRKIIKCDGCRDRSYDGACVSACPTIAIQWIKADELRAGDNSMRNESEEVNTHA